MDCKENRSENASTYCITSHMNSPAWPWCIALHVPPSWSSCICPWVFGKESFSRERTNTLLFTASQELFSLKISFRKKFTKAKKEVRIMKSESWRNRKVDRNIERKSYVRTRHKSLKNPQKHSFPKCFKWVWQERLKEDDELCFSVKNFPRRLFHSMNIYSHSHILCRLNLDRICTLKGLETFSADLGSKKGSKK